MISRPYQLISLIAVSALDVARATQHVRNEHLKMETEYIILASVLSGAWLLLLIVVMVMCCQLSSLRKQVTDMQNTSRLRIQKLKMNNDNNHAFHNPALSPDEELSRRGYSMYMATESQSDVESGRHHPDRHPDRPQERQTGGQFVEELIHELDNRQQRQQQTSVPPFLLQSIQDNKMKTRTTMNPIANGHGRQSDTNPNFIY